jgi:hypothetical protein
VKIFIAVSNVLNTHAISRTASAPLLHYVQANSIDVRVPAVVEKEDDDNNMCRK